MLNTFLTYGISIIRNPKLFGFRHDIRRSHVEYQHLAYSSLVVSKIIVSSIINQTRVLRSSIFCVLQF